MADMGANCVAPTIVSTLMACDRGSSVRGAERCSDLFKLLVGTKHTAEMTKMVTLLIRNLFNAHTATDFSSLLKHSVDTGGYTFPLLMNFDACKWISTYQLQDDKDNHICFEFSSPDDILSFTTQLRRSEFTGLICDYVHNFNCVQF
ncbi:hypothetical protein RYX36_012550 [Vicia faba]